MIIVSGVLSDEMIELVCARLRQMNYDYVFLDQSRYIKKYRLNWKLSQGKISGYLIIGGKKIDLRSVTGVYVRYIDYSEPREIKRSPLEKRYKELIFGEQQLGLIGLFEALRCPVVNKVLVSTSNDSKPYQSLVIKKHGFKIPKTIITNIKEEAMKFYASCRGKVIYKSISGIRSIVKRFEKKDFARVNLIANCPVQFQEQIPGDDIRVHTVGKETFASRVISKATDYRYASLDKVSWSMEPVKLPEKVAENCLKLSKAFGLLVAGIDLRRTPAGEYYCFEVNPSPGFIFYERHSGHEISKAIARLLKGGQSKNFSN